ncbi:MAG TPA: hypothetical protein VEW90_05590 [Gaiellaceae bacterium]|nr:hypothetical protein [Gaiellaceae bacterium]
MRLGLASLIVVVATLGLVAGPGSSTAVRAAETPVPSLEPAATEELWRELVTSKPLRTQAAECRPLRAVFYAASDWIRLATKLAATASPCADYHVSVPPLVADKTTFRRDQASRIRALGPNYHALAEIHFATWTRWVASTGSSWYTAGVTARQRMAEAGYDVSRGDSWMLNELTSAVRRGDGNARANVRELLRGLYEGGEGAQRTRGAVLVIGFGQRTSDLSVYQNTMQGWLSDSAFWTDMARYVSDWSQEVYGDLRAHAVPGSPNTDRRELLNDYLQHKLVLANAGPAEIEPARAFLRATFSPLANGAWPRETAWGWTMVPAEQMAAYLAAQVNALRFFSATSAQAADHWGFAWAPRNTTGLSTADFAAQTGLLLDRLALAVRDSGDVVDPENPGSGACGAGEAACAVDLAEARHNGAWRSFRAWAQSSLTIAATPATLPAGAISPPLQLALSSAVTRPLSVTLRSSSPAGTFSTSTAGPWTSTLVLPVSPQTGIVFYYRDTRAGQVTLTASAPGTTQATSQLTILPGAAARISVTPAARDVRVRGETTFTAAAVDSFGNPAASAATWTVAPTGFGTFVRGQAGSVTFRAGRTVGTGTVTAAAGSLVASSTVTVRPAALRVPSVTYRRTSRGVEATLAAVDPAGSPVSRTSLTLVVTLDDERVARSRVATGASGKARLAVSRGSGCYVVTVVRAVAQGFVWNGRTPRNRFCRR